MDDRKMYMCGDDETITMTTMEMMLILYKDHQSPKSKDDYHCQFTIKQIYVIINRQSY